MPGPPPVCILLIRGRTLLFCKFNGSMGNNDKDFVSWRCLRWLDSFVLSIWILTYFIWNMPLFKWNILYMYLVLGIKLLIVLMMQDTQTLNFQSERGELWSRQWEISDTWRQIRKGNYFNYEQTVGASLKEVWKMLSHYVILYKLFSKNELSIFNGVCCFNIANGVCCSIMFLQAKPLKD